METQSGKKSRVVLRAFAVALLLLTAEATTGNLPGDDRRARHAWLHDHDRREATPAARSGLRRRDQGESLGVDAVVAGARRAAEGCAERAADHDG